MPFSVSWHALLDEAEALPSDTTLITPLSQNRFRITDTQEHRVISEYHTVGYNYVKIFHTPGCRNTSRDYSRQYQESGDSRSSSSEEVFPG